MFNMLAGKTNGTDISIFFKSLYPKYCPLSYKILNVLSNNIAINSTVYNSFFGLIGNTFTLFS